MSPADGEDRLCLALIDQAADDAGCACGHDRCGFFATVPTRVGLQKVSNTTFEALRAAPERGYDTIAVQTITPGVVM